MVAPASTIKEVTVERQLRRYFVGIISFGFIVTWIAVGTTAAFLGLIGAAISTIVPGLLDVRRARRRAAERRGGHNVRPRGVTARQLADESPEELPLVPDEPSLIIGVSN
jgi:hypothetical protein